ncbi:hypothetical protein HBZC1_00920 [Helicobacter bizzozeronii CIII-1]|uniref:Uncharacterized protein n=1 Tax=Helicobacter bizzozeronii (strain CIII-1) TaxID=1002804 RepID=F8KQS4_HELBC|nr:hypothetical protein [Helicobacter bizzozeronii]CCB79078.1 hypothetical protein HBZC1_00920 [Helicobacter bizzozeronii CIII-1]
MPFLLWMGLLFLPLLANPIQEMQTLYRQAHPPSLHAFLINLSPQRQQILQLAQSIAIPILKQFRASTSTERAILRAMHLFSALALLELIQESMPDDPKVPQFSKTAKQIALDFSQINAFLYTPLLQLQQHTINPFTHIELIHHYTNTHACWTPDCLSMDEIWQNTDSLEVGVYNDHPHKSPALTHLFQDLDTGLRVYGILNRLMGLGDDSPTTLVVDFAQVLGNPNLATLLYQLLDYHYFQSIHLAKIGGAYLEILAQLKSALSQIESTPEVCLHPSYLDSKFLNLCLKSFQNPSKTLIQRMQKKLKEERLITLDHIPCLYDNLHRQIQVFKSENALCLALQKHLTREFK